MRMARTLLLAASFLIAVDHAEAGTVTIGYEITASSADVRFVGPQTIPVRGGMLTLRYTANGPNAIVDGPAGGTLSWSGGAFSFAVDPTLTTGSGIRVFRSGNQEITFVAAGLDAGVAATAGGAFELSFGFPTLQGRFSGVCTGYCGRFPGWFTDYYRGGIIEGLVNPAQFRFAGGGSTAAATLLAPFEVFANGKDGTVNALNVVGQEVSRSFVVPEPAPAGALALGMLFLVWLARARR